MIRGKGFTLTELMIAVAIVGILAAIAYPSYIDSVRKSRRPLAKSALLEVAQREEAYYARKAAYATALGALGYTGLVGGKLPVKDDSGVTRYQLSISAATAGCPVNSCYSLEAEAVGDQANDLVAAYRLDASGNKQQSDGTNWVNGWPD